MEINKEKVFEKLNEKISEAGSQKAYAEQLSITPGYLGDLLHERRDLSPNILDKLGYIPLLIYVPTERAEAVKGAVENVLEAKPVRKRPTAGRPSLTDGR